MTIIGDIFERSARAEENSSRGIMSRNSFGAQQRRVVQSTSAERLGRGSEEDDEEEDNYDDDNRSSGGKKFDNIEAGEWYSRQQH